MINSSFIKNQCRAITCK